VLLNLQPIIPMNLRQQKSSTTVEGGCFDIEMFDSSRKPKNQLQRSKDSIIHYFKNGELQHVFQEDIYEGTYHAAVSLYMHAVCKVNFGGWPFKYKPAQPKTDTPWLPYSALATGVSQTNTHPENFTVPHDRQRFLSLQNFIGEKQLNEQCEYREKSEEEEDDEDEYV
jgi:hypothetical protein